MQRLNFVLITKDCYLEFMFSPVQQFLNFTFFQTSLNLNVRATHQNLVHRSFCTVIVHADKVNFHKSLTFNYLNITVYMH